jgi:hypothetical protein
MLRVPDAGLIDAGATGTGAGVGKPSRKEPAGRCAAAVRLALWGLRLGSDGDGRSDAVDAGCGDTFAPHEGGVRAARSHVGRQFGVDPGSFGQCPADTG